MYFSPKRFVFLYPIGPRVRLAFDRLFLLQTPTTRTGNKRFCFNIIYRFVPCSKQFAAQLRGPRIICQLNALLHWSQITKASIKRSQNCCILKILFNNIFSFLIQLCSFIVVTFKRQHYFFKPTSKKGCILYLCCIVKIPFFCQ